MKFINYLKDIEGVGIYPLASLIIFSTFFIAVIIYVYSIDAKKLQEEANIPLK